uniref:PDZ domain-containing protein n=1 Tax=Plectus sambesii TaxID=2011161 RepID=A0A914XNH5_9BILA
MARYQHVDVTLHRDALHMPWGFRLRGGRDFDEPLVIERVAADGAAQGQLHPGDQLLALQGHNASQLVHQEATSIILNSGSQLAISVLRPMTANHTPNTSTTQSNRQNSTTPVNGQNAAAPSRWRSNSEGEKEPPKIATNSNLAKLMTSTLSTVDPNARSRWSPSRCSTPSLRKGPTMNSLGIPPKFRDDTGYAREEDITLYLPRRPSGRQTPQPQAYDPRNYQMRDALSLSLRSPTGTFSGRKTPTVVEIGSPTSNGPHRPSSAVGVWTPPVHQPNSKLVHMQYNSPMSLYTPNNVADMIEKQTGSKIAWQKKPPVRFLDDITDSPTYQFVQNLEQERPMRATSEGPLNQSLTLRHLQRYYDRANVH